MLVGGLRVTVTVTVTVRVRVRVRVSLTLTLTLSPFAFALTHVVILATHIHVGCLDTYTCTQTYRHITHPHLCRLYGNIHPQDTYALLPPTRTHKSVTHTRIHRPHTTHNTRVHAPHTYRAHTTRVQVVSAVNATDNNLRCVSGCFLTLPVPGSLTHTHA